MVRRLAGFLGVCLLLGSAAGSVRAQSAQDPVYVFHTSLGDLRVQLYPDVAPQTVANFLRYVNRGAYDTSFIHRSVPGFIIQGGGYTDSSQSGVQTIPTDAPVVNEFHLSNTRGTLAMAKLGGSPNSATDEWFFNLADNSASLDPVPSTTNNPSGNDGGYTVFGKVTDSAGLAVMDRIAAVPVYNAGSPFDQIPLVNYGSGTIQTSNLVAVSAITPAAGAHVLWDKTDGMASVWSYDTAAGGFTQNSYGPYVGWTAKAVADSPGDGLTRILWDKADGTASIWNLDNATGVFSQFAFGPYAGWTATTLSADTGSTTRVLWTNTNGTTSLWNYSTASGTFTQNAYGPYPGWTAKAVADGGTDGKTRLLWSKTDGTASIWSLNNSTGSFTQFSFGPYAGWNAVAVSVGTDNTTHILWTNTDGRASVWNYSAVSGTFTQNTYGPYAGWTAAGVSDGADGLTRVLWDNTSGTASLWSLNNATGVFSQFSFGPYAGWTAAGLSSGG